MKREQILKYVEIKGEEISELGELRGEEAGKEKCYLGKRRE